MAWERSIRCFLSWPNPVIKLNKGEVGVKQHSCMSAKVAVSVMDDVWSCKPGERFLNTCLLTLRLLLCHHSLSGKWPTCCVSAQNPFQGGAERRQGATVVSLGHWWRQLVSPPQLTCCYSDANAMDRLERAVYSPGDTYVCCRVTCRFVKLNPPLMLSEDKKWLNIIHFLMVEV